MLNLFQFTNFFPAVSGQLFNLSLEVFISMSLNFYFSMKIFPDLFFFFFTVCFCLVACIPIFYRLLHPVLGCTFLYCFRLPLKGLYFLVWFGILWASLHELFFMEIKSFLHDGGMPSLFQFCIYRGSNFLVDKFTLMCRKYLKANFSKKIPSSPPSQTCFSSHVVPFSMKGTTGLLGLCNKAPQTGCIEQ